MSFHYKQNNQINSKKQAPIAALSTIIQSELSHLKHSQLQSEPKNNFKNSFKKDLIAQITTHLSDIDVKILNYLIHQSNKYQQLYPSYDQIASYVGCSTRTIQRHCRYLESLGLIKMTFRLMTSSLYEINAILFQYGIKLRHIFQALNQSARIWLFGAFLAPVAYSEQVVLPIEENLIVLYNPSSYSVSPSRARSATAREGLKKENILNSTPIKISTTLKQVTQALNLTRLGQIKLLAFSEGVLSNTWNTLKSRIMQARDPFGYLHAACNKHSQSMNLEPCYSLVPLLTKKYQVDPFGKTTRAPQRDVSSQTSLQPKKVEYVNIPEPEEGLTPEWKRSVILNDPKLAWLLSGTNFEPEVKKYEPRAPSLSDPKPLSELLEQLLPTYN